MKEFIIKHFFSNSLLPITAIFIITTVFVLFKPNRFLSVLFYQLTDYDFSLRILDINQYVGCLIYVAFAYYYVFLVPTITFYLYFNFTHSLTNNENSRFWTFIVSLLVFHFLVCFIWYADLRLTFVTIFSTLFSDSISDFFIDFNKLDASRRINSRIGDFRDGLRVVYFLFVYLSFVNYYFFSDRACTRWFNRFFIIFLSFYFFGGDGSTPTIRRYSFLFIEAITFFVVFLKFVDRITILIK